MHAFSPLSQADPRYPQPWRPLRNIGAVQQHTPSLPERRTQGNTKDCRAVSSSLPLSTSLPPLCSQSSSVSTSFPVISSSAPAVKHKSVSQTQCPPRCPARFNATLTTGILRHMRTAAHCTCSPKRWYVYRSARLIHALILMIPCVAVDQTNDLEKRRLNCKLSSSLDVRFCLLTA